MPGKSECFIPPETKSSARAKAPWIQWQIYLKRGTSCARSRRLQQSRESSSQSFRRPRRQCSPCRFRSDTRGTKQDRAAGVQPGCPIFRHKRGASPAVSRESVRRVGYAADGALADGDSGEVAARLLSSRLWAVTAGAAARRRRRPAGTVPCGRQLIQFAENRTQFVHSASWRVCHPWRDGGLILPQDKALGFEQAQTFRQHLRRDTRDLLTQYPESCRSLRRENPQNIQGPGSGQDAEQRGHGAQPGRMGVAFLHAGAGGHMVTIRTLVTLCNSFRLPFASGAHPYEYEH
jgi:hypothetical protein